MNEIYEHAKKMTSEPEMLRIAKWYSEASPELVERIEKAVMGLVKNAMCPITPPICGALTAIGYFEWCVGGGSSREFAIMFAKVMDIVQ